MAYNPYYEEPEPGLRFSRTETLHLAVAVVALTLAFALVLDDDKPLSAAAFVPEPLTLLGAFLATSSGFVLHEMAHKVAAQRYGHWAEFRADFRTFGFTLLLAALLRILFAAPGAVLIAGNVTRRESGIISVVGPGMNFLIAATTLPFTFVANPDAPVPYVLGIVARVNALLCVFNLLPINPLDGRKVWTWSKAAWVVGVVAGGGLAVVAFIGVP